MELMIMFLFIGFFVFVYQVLMFKQKKKEVSCKNKRCKTVMRIEDIKKMRCETREVLEAEEDYFYEVFSRVWQCPNCGEDILYQEI